DLARRIERLLDGVLRDLVKPRTTDWSATALFDLTGDVPRDGLALAIRVGREEDLARFFGGRFELGEGFFFALDRDVLGLEAVVDVDAEFFFWEITHVTDGRFDAIAAA